MEKHRQQSGKTFVFSSALMVVASGGFADRCVTIVTVAIRDFVASNLKLFSYHSGRPVDKIWKPYRVVGHETTKRLKLEIFYFLFYIFPYKTCTTHNLFN